MGNAIIEKRLKALETKKRIVRSINWPSIICNYSDSAEHKESLFRDACEELGLPEYDASNPDHTSGHCWITLVTDVKDIIPDAPWLSETVEQKESIADEYKVKAA